MKLYKVDITPASLFREFPSSYTIFGAISWGYKILYGGEKLKSLLGRFSNGNPPFIISSILPIYQDKYFFPKPNLKAEREKNSDIDYKKLKKLSFVDIEILEKVLEGKIKTELELHKELNQKKLPKISISERDSVPHASIDRIFNTTEGSGGLYFEEVVAIGRGFILIVVENETVKKEIETVFKLLQDIGLGGNRSIGFGRVFFGSFEEFPQLEKYFLNQTDKFLTLSPIIPEPNTYSLFESFYEYFTFRGAIDNNYDFKKVDIWKDKVVYLKEGSMLKTKVKKNFYGLFYKAKDINGTKVYQYGLGFPLYIQGD